ncbi:MAG: hypothetical protein JRN57_01810 [Nitrososphaerota archaeon]|nr:hypothetical protein [Nitrososphaerota archaeon]
MSAPLLAAFDPGIYVSLAFLFGIAAQFRAMDGYSFLRRLLASLEGRLGALYAVALLTFAFSPFILNDVLILILTPPLIKYARQRGVDPAPLVVAEVTLTNIASSLTPIGNPQNILLWTASGVGFESFVLGTWPYVVASAALAAVALYPFSRETRKDEDIGAGPIGPLGAGWYLALVTASVLVFDYAGLPSYLGLGLGFALGFAFTRNDLRGVGREFDLRSLLILCMFVAAVTAASFFITGIAAPYVAPAAEGAQPYSGLFMAVVSNVISNVPATQLLIRVSGVAAAVAPKIAVEAGLAGNLGPVASFANLLALQMAARSGVKLRKIIILQTLVGIVAFIPALL